MRKLKAANSASYVIVDAEFYERFKELSLYVRHDGYVRVTIDGVREFLHRIITKCPKGMTVDHINGNPLDNRRINLRICTARENVRNSRKQPGTVSKYKGVRFDRNGKRRKRWLAGIEESGKNTTIGRFHTEEEAALAYNKIAKERFGDFAKLNVVDPSPHENTK